jgi:ABC-2 type transport system permease protein
VAEIRSVVSRKHISCSSDIPLELVRDWPPAYANLIFLPVLWLPGLFIPLPKLFSRDVGGDLAGVPLESSALGTAGVSEFSFVAPQISAAVLLGFTVLFGGVAIRRLARRG